MIQVPARLSCQPGDNVLDRVNLETDRLLQMVRDMTRVRASSVREVRTYVARMQALVDKIDVKET